MAQRFSAAIRIVYPRLQSLRLAFGWRSALALRFDLSTPAALATDLTMAAPHRGNTGFSTYFITANTFQKHGLFQSDRMACLFLDVLSHYRAKEKYLLHEFVIMPDHFHLLITPKETLERALQLIKGGFSFRAKRELRFGGEIWEKSFYDHRVRDWEEDCAFRQYIHLNPVKRGLINVADQYSYSSAKAGMVLDALPQRLKPSGGVAV